MHPGNNEEENQRHRADLPETAYLLDITDNW
jgi:hypothetical protein